MKKTVYILVGAPGSGKSEWLRRRLPSATAVSADYFFEQSNGSYVFYPTKLRDAHNACMRDFLEHLAGSTGRVRPEVVAVDNTNTSVEEAIPYVRVAQACDYDVRVFVFTGEYTNVHGVPPEKVAAMRERVRKNWLAPNADMLCRRYGLFSLDVIST